MQPRSILVVGLLALLVPGTSLAHGGVSIDADLCILTAGPYRMHFTGYQPLARGSEEFCEDIPVVGQAVIVLDYVDRVLRPFMVDFRIVSDVAEIGVSATSDDLGTVSDIEAATLHYLAPSIYAAGTLKVEYEFAEAGRYIGIVTVRDPSNGAEFTSVFPFAVGLAVYVKYLPYAIGALLFLGLLGYYFMYPGRPQGASEA